jgi:hypothetical protein
MESKFQDDGGIAVPLRVAVSSEFKRRREVLLRCLINAATGYARPLWPHRGR